MMNKKLLLNSKTRVHRPYPISDQKRLKTIPFRAAHTYIAHIREYATPPGVKKNTLVHIDDPLRLDTLKITNSQLQAQHKHKLCYVAARLLVIHVLFTQQ